MKINGLSFVIENYVWLIPLILFMIVALYIYDKYFFNISEIIDNQNDKRSSKTCFLKDYDIKSARIATLIIFIIFIFGYLLLNYLGQ